MKKYTLILSFFMILSLSAFSQTSKDKVQFGGEFSLNSHIFSDFFRMNITPNMTGGYFVTDHILVRGGLEGSLHLNEINVDDLRWRLGVGLGCRNYFGHQRLQPFLGANVFFAALDRGELNGGTFKEYKYTAELGCSFFIKENLAIELAAPISYNIIRSDDRTGFFGIPDEKSWRNHTTIGFQFYL